MPAKRRSVMQIRRAVAAVEMLEARQLLTTVTAADESPLVTTFGPNQLSYMTGGTRDFQSFAALAPGVGNTILAAGYMQTAGGNQVAIVEEFSQANGAVVSSFGTGGVAVIDVNSAGNTWATAIGVGANNIIYVAGTSTATPTGPSSGWVTSLTSAGKPNTAFNGGKIQTFSFGAGDTSVSAILTKPTGTTFNVIGNYYNPTAWTGGAGVGQFFTTGGFDKSYNGTGMFTTNPGANKDEFATGGVYTSTGEIALSATQFTVGTVGSKKQFTSAYGEALEIKIKGGLDLTFGSGGRTAPVKYTGYNYNFANGIAIDPRNNDLVLGGDASNGSYLTGTPTPYGAPSTALPAATISAVGGIRFTNKGIRDTTFNYDPFTFNPGWLSAANSVHVDANGGVTLDGGSGPLNGNSSFAVARLNNTGGFNTFFNGTGKSTQAVSGGSAWINADFVIPHKNQLNFQDYNDDFWGGSIKLGTKLKWALGQYEYRYQLPSFQTSPVVPTVGTNGLATFKYRDVTDGTAATFNSNNQWVVGGDTAFAGKFKYGFVSLFTQTGAPITTFGTGGMTAFSFSSNGDTTVSAVRTLSNNDIIVAGNYVSNGSTFAYIGDLMPNGKWRTTFNGTGYRWLSWGPYSAISAIAIEPGDKIDFAGGFFSETTFSGGAAFGRLNSNGGYDTSFNGTGTMLTNPGAFKVEAASSLVLKPGGGFDAGGAQATIGFSPTFTAAITNANMEVFSVKSNGTLDNTFGTGGRAFANFGTGNFSFGTSIAWDPRNNFIVEGGAVTNGGFDFGVPLGGANSLLPPATSAKFAAARWDLTGKLDKTFNGSGMESVDFGAGYLAGASSLGVLKNGDIILAGGAELNHGMSRTARVRFLAVGGLDLKFVNKGYYIQQVTGAAVGAFNYIIVPHYNASNVLDYYFGFYTGHEKIDANLAYLLLGWDWWCDF